MALKIGTITWCCLIIGMLLAISSVECKTKIKHNFSSWFSKKTKYQYEVQNSVYDFPHGMGMNVTLDYDYVTDCNLYIETKLCDGAIPICMNNGTIMCVANSESIPCPAADCVTVRKKQCNPKSTQCEKTYPCLVRLRKLLRDVTNRKVIDPPPFLKGLCVTLVAVPKVVPKQ
ncbi:hypothetical protein ILUMI_13086 [Ignelater luminosus]|uniref:Uncharacterized protein n=1 Tax=Ignelater luminosus TaxID=2038154 RepID=A0A8K0CV57_IGNLU|nr:hypothetical protein ILUMI_13086 [Ignelater luminosus]